MIEDYSGNADSPRKLEAKRLYSMLAAEESIALNGPLGKDSKRRCYTIQWSPCRPGTRLEGTVDLFSESYVAVFWEDHFQFKGAKRVFGSVEEAYAYVTLITQEQYDDADRIPTRATKARRGAVPPLPGNGPDDAPR